MVAARYTCQARRTVHSAAQHRPRRERNAPVLRQLGHRAHQIIARRRFEPGFLATRSAVRPRSIPSSLGTYASVQICEFTDPRRIIRQIGQFVQHDVRFEVTNRLDKCLPVEDITEIGLAPRWLSNSVLLGERVRPPTTCPA